MWPNPNDILHNSDSTTLNGSHFIKVLKSLNKKWMKVINTLQSLSYSIGRENQIKVYESKQYLQGPRLCSVANKQFQKLQWNWPKYLKFILSSENINTPWCFLHINFKDTNLIRILYSPRFQPPGSFCESWDAACSLFLIVLHQSSIHVVVYLFTSSYPTTHAHCIAQNNAALITHSMLILPLGSLYKK